MEKDPPFLRPSASPWSPSRADHLIHRELTERIIACAIAVHRELGPGFLECIYEQAFAVELARQEIGFVRQLSVEIGYQGVNIGTHRIDLVVNQTVVVELKAIREIEEVHLAIVLSYLKAMNLRLGLIINFGGAKTRIRRVLRGYPKQTTEERRGGEAEGD